MISPTAEISAVRNFADASKTMRASIWEGSLPTVSNPSKSGVQRSATHIRSLNIKKRLKKRAAFLDVITFLELVYTAACINQLLLTGKERMAFVANIHL